MELVEHTKYWLENIEYFVSFKSWDDFLSMSDSLLSNWYEVNMFTWACRKNEQGFLLQISFINLKPLQHNRLPILNKSFYLIKCIFVSFEEKDVENIKKWLTSHNPNLWNTDLLINQTNLKINQQ